MTLHPHHVGLNVTDLGRSVAFYGTLGFEQVTETRTPDGVTIAFLQLGALRLELFAYPEPLPPCAGTRTLGLRHLALATDDMDATMAELRDAGILPADAAPRTLPTGMRLLFFPDPDGAEIEILQESPRG